MVPVQVEDFDLFEPRGPDDCIVLYRGDKECDFSSIILSNELEYNLLVGTSVTSVSEFQVDPFDGYGWDLESLDEVGREYHGCAS